MVTLKDIAEKAGVSSMDRIQGDEREDGGCLTEDFREDKEDRAGAGVCAKLFWPVHLRPAPRG